MCAGSAGYGSVVHASALPQHSTAVLVLAHTQANKVTGQLMFGE